MLPEHSSAPQQSNSADRLGSMQELRPQGEISASQEAFKRRLKLQNAAARLLPDERVSECLREIAPVNPRSGQDSIQWDHVAVKYSQSRKTAHFDNLKVCNSVWTCPVCAARISEERRKQLSAAMDATPYFPVLATFTLRHHQGDELRSVLGALLDSYRALKAGRWWQDFKARWHWIGDVRSLEVTYGQNGWHPHIHAIMLFNHPLDLHEIEALQESLTGRWLAVLARHGADATAERGVDVRAGDQYVQEYLAKWGRDPAANEDSRWSIEHEVTKSAQKQATGKGRTPFQLLADYDNGDNQAGALFVEYAQVFKGRNQLVWSRGLKDEIRYDDFAEEEPGDDEVLARIDRRGWRKVVRLGLRGELLAVAAQLDQSRLYQWWYDHIWGDDPSP